jgi:signal transduction histidine kinase
MSSQIKSLNRILSVFLIVLFFSLKASGQTKQINEIHRKLKQSNLPDTAKINLLNELAFVHRNYYPDSTILLANKALQLSQELGYGKGIADAYKQLAIGNFIITNLPKAKEFNRSALDAYKKNGDKKGEGAVLNNMAMIYHNEGKLDQAIQYYQLSLSLRKEVNDQKGIGDSYNNIGNTYADKGNYKEAIEHYFRSLTIRENLKDSFGIANSYASIAGIYFLLKKHDDALKHAHTALQIQKSIGAKGEMIQSLVAIGGVCSEKAQLDSSIYYYKIAYELALEIDSKSDAIVCLTNFGEVFNLMNQPDSAIFYFNKAYKFCLEFEDEPGMGFCDIGLGKSYLLKHQYKEAQLHSLSGYKIAQKSNNKMQIYEAAKGLAKAYEGLGNVNDAIQYLKISIVYRDSLFSEENTNRTHQIEYDYLLEKKQNEIQLLEKDNAIQTAKSQFTYSVAIGLAIIILILGVLVYFVLASRAKEIKSKEIVIQQKQAIEKQAKDLEELNLYKNKIFSILTHDIRNPIASLNQVVELMGDDLLNAEDLGFIKNRLANQLKSINILLDNVLNWSKSQLEGELKPMASHVQLSNLVNQSIELFEQFAQQKQVSVHNLVPQDFKVWVDPNHLDLAIRNILFNAIKFSFQNSSVEIFAETKQGKAYLSIKDKGKGMDEAELATLFSFNKQPGVYGTQGERGAGIGLILTREFVTKNGGEILVQTEPNKGSTFTLVFPERGE